MLKLAPDLWDNFASADAREAAFIKSVDDWMVFSEETLPVLQDGFRIPLRTEIDLVASGITNVLWATSYAFDFSFVRLPILDGDGFPIQTAGVTSHPNLYFAGLPRLPTTTSGLL